ncbi:MAG TPA: nuclease-related domain-containing protein [Aggregatilineales bacterium]|nr:nuclease-related domain-containing protein [Aggregatilineales bacterium]
MQNINPTHTRNRRALFYLSVLGFPVLIGGCTAITSIALMTQFPVFGNSTTLAMVCLGLFSIPAIIGGGLAVYRGLTLEKDNPVAYEVGETLRSFLDDRYTFIRNVSRRKLGYIDAVLIGPPGALVFRTVDYSGTWRNERAEWKIKDRKGSMRSAPSNPSRECARDVYALRDYFARRNLDKVPVYGIVVFHSQNLILQGAGQVVPIAETHRIYDVLVRDYLAEDSRISFDQARAAISAITE